MTKLLLLLSLCSTANALIAPIPVTVNSGDAVSVSGSTVTAQINSLPSLVAGSALIGSVNVLSQSTASVSGSTVTAQINALPSLIAGSANIGTINGSTVGAVVIGTPNVNVVSQATTSVSGSSVTAQINVLPALVAGTANIGTVNGSTVGISILPALVAGTANIGTVNGSTVGISILPALVAGTANIGTVNGSTVGVVFAGAQNVNVISQSTSSVSGSTVTAQINLLPSLVAGTANIGTVNGSTISVSGSSVTAQINSLPALVAGTANIGTINGSTIALAGGAQNIGTVSGSTISIVGVAGAGVVVSQGSTVGKTEIHKTFVKATAAVGRAIIGTYTVTTGKTLYVTSMDITGYLTAISATAVLVGSAIVDSPSGVDISSAVFFNPTTSATTTWYKNFQEPMAVASGVVIMSSAVANAATATTWVFNLDGYER